MRYEDILPAIRAGRLARRSSWPVRECVGATEYGMREGSATSLTKFHRYDRESSNGTWCNVTIDRDMLADDWELIPEVLKGDGLRSDAREVLNELALQFAKEGPETYPKETLARNLSMLVHEATEAYRSEDVDRLKGALLHGLAALITLQSEKPFPPNGR